MPLEWRKVTLTATRAQTDPYSNRRLKELLQPIVDSNLHIVNPHTSIPFGPEAFIDSLSTITRSIYLCSVISYFIRSEVFDPVEASQIRETGILKELSAALQPDQQQVLDYRALSLDTWLPRAGENPVCGAKTSRDWRKGIQSLQRLFDEQQHIFIPHYNTRKNVGYVTQQNYHNLFFNDFSSLPDHDTKPVDLIKHYHETGEQVPGPMEMRFAWRYNDLKGRVYYATGGDCLWPGLFIKQIAKDILCFRSMICGHGNRTVHKITCIRTPPDWYNEIIYDEGPI